MEKLGSAFGPAPFLCVCLASGGAGTQGKGPKGPLMPVLLLTLSKGRSDSRKPPVRCERPLITGPRATICGTH